MCRGSSPYCFHKEGDNCPCEEGNNKVKWPKVISQFYTYSLMDLLYPCLKYTVTLMPCWFRGRHKDPPPSSPQSLPLSLLCCGGQKPKISSPNGLRLRGVFPLALSQLGSMSQSGGVTPMSRTWGLVRDTASLRRHKRKVMRSFFSFFK